VNSDFRDILSAFCAEAVEFLLVGAYALAVHGLPRATGDIDLWVATDEGNARRVWQALGRFGAPLADLTIGDLCRANTVFQIGVAPQRIDVLTGIDGVDFPTAWAQRVEVVIEGLTVPVLSRELLIRNKRATGRPQDLADVAWLESNK
jgi:hypothetical protein